MALRGGDAGPHSRRGLQPDLVGARKTERGYTLNHRFSVFLFSWLRRHDPKKSKAGATLPRMWPENQENRKTRLGVYPEWRFPERVTSARIERCLAHHAQF